MPHDEIVQYILENPAEVVAQVVFGKYVESSGLVFSGELIQMAIDRSLQRVTSDSWVDGAARDYARNVFGKFGPGYRDHNTRWFTGVDFARQTDYTVISTIDTSTYPARLVYFKRLNRVPWETIYTEVGRAREMFGPNILVDSTGMAGDVIIDALDGRMYCPIHHRSLMGQDRCPEGTCDREWYLSIPVDAFSFQTASKKQLLEHLRDKMGQGYLMGSGKPFGALRIPPIVQLEEELSFYAWDDKRLETDCLMSLALAVMHGMDDVVGDVLVGSTVGR